VWSRRIKETFAVITVGDGIIAFLAPREHSLLWELGPEGARKVARFFADNSNYMRLLGATQVAFGVWLAFRQYRED
jgi:uncharacterized protein YjeT (DUF2065 family)